MKTFLVEIIYKFSSQDWYFLYDIINSETKQLSLNYQNNTIMGALELRDSVLEYINTADERLLKVVKAVIESYQENDVVTYTIEGLPLTRIAYKEELQEAIAEIKRGEYSTQEDVEKESNNW